MTKTITRVFAVVFLTAVAACNTVEGIGQDLRSAGNSIEKAAN